MKNHDNSIIHEKIQSLIMRFGVWLTINIISDEIKRLINLEIFDIWQVHLKYLSPELFLLPKLSKVNFFLTQYAPTREVLDACEIFKAKNKNHHDSALWEERWLTSFHRCILLIYTLEHACPWIFLRCCSIDSANRTGIYSDRHSTG